MKVKRSTMQFHKASLQSSNSKKNAIKTEPLKNHESRNTKIKLPFTSTENTLDQELKPNETSS